MQSEFVSSEPRPREERPPIRVAVLLDGDADFVNALALVVIHIVLMSACANHSLASSSCPTASTAGY